MIAQLEDIATVMAMIEERAEKDGWDQKPQLFALMLHDLSDEVGVIGAGLFPGFDSAVRATGHSHFALRFLNLMTDLAEQRPDMELPEVPNLFALALVDEAWVVPHEPGQPRPTGSFSEHPDRIEARFVLLVAGDGSTRSLMRTRGDSEPREREFSENDEVLVSQMASLLSHYAPGYAPKGRGAE